MHWGSSVTYIGSTTLKEKTVTFGIKDTDRTKHFSILGRTGSGRGDMVVSMALQDIERGVGVVLLDATGTSATKLLERIKPEHASRVVFLDPSDAEYPYSWNLVDDIKTLPEVEQVSAYVEAVCHIFKLTPTTFIASVASLILKKPDATVVMFHMLLTDEKFRGKFFEGDDAGREALEAQMKLASDAVEALEREGKYIAKDTLVRNLIGQKDSKFTLDHLPDGQIVIVDFSHIRMYPTRMTPIVCTFAHAVRMASRRSKTPIALYMHDTIRYLSEAEIDSLLSPHHNVAVTIADTLIQESDQERRLYALSRSSSVASFAAHPGDKTLLEHAFYPFVEVDDLVRLEPKEFIVALTIDGVRGKPFFAQTLPLGEKKNLSYQDMVVAARQRYTTVRSKVDAILKAQTTLDDDDDDEDDAGPASPRGFQDAFRSIFAKQAEKAKAAVAGEPVGAGAQGAPAGITSPPPSAQPPTQSQPAPGKKEVPEDLLKQMLYVAPVSLALFFLTIVPVPVHAVSISKFLFINEPHQVEINEVSPQITVEAQDASGTPVNGNTICLEITSTSAMGEFSSNGSTWGESPFRTLALTLSSNQYRRNFYYRDVTEGTATLTLSAATRPNDTTCPEFSVANNSTWTATQSIMVGNQSSSGSPMSTPAPESQGSGVESTTSGGGSGTIEPQIIAYAGPDRTVFVGADSVFKGYAEGITGDPLPNARFLWTFGNGDIREGQSILYNFPFPGTYAVVLDVANGLYSASDRVVVQAVPAELTISEVTDEFIALKNNNAIDIDLAGWILFASGKQFQFPQNTIVLAGHEVLISNMRTGLSGEFPDTVLLQYPNGIVAVTYEQPLFLTRAVSNLAKEEVSVKGNASVLAATPILSDAKPKESDLVATPLGAVAETIPSVPSYLGWLVGVLALAGIAGAGVLFLRGDDESKEFTIKEIQK